MTAAWQCRHAPGWGFRHALCSFLIEEHVRVAAPIAIVDGERVAANMRFSHGSRSSLLLGIPSLPPNRVRVVSAVR